MQMDESLYSFALVLSTPSDWSTISPQLNSTTQLSSPTQLSYSSPLSSFLYSSPSLYSPRLSTHTDWPTIYPLSRYTVCFYDFRNGRSDGAVTVPVVPVPLFQVPSHCCRFVTQRYAPLRLFSYTLGSTSLNSKAPG